MRDGINAEGVRKEDVSIELMRAQSANVAALEHHYLHRKRVGSLLAYRVIHQDRDMGLLLFARPMVSHPMFGYQPTEIIELARVWFKENPKNLGSCAIRKACKRLHKDWPGTKAIISWCDTSRFDGAMYKASGFEFRGLSRLRIPGGRVGRKVQYDRLTPKQRWLIVL
jgi:hypothetical protein